MKVLLIGSTGRVGGCVARRALKDFPSGSVTIFVRDKIKLEGLIRAELLSRAEVVEGSIFDADALRRAMLGKDVCISTAGNANSSDPSQYHELFKRIVNAAAEYLVGPKRLWMMAGLTVLDVPHAKPPAQINDLPIFSSLPFTIHSKNLDILYGAKEQLNWSIMCPGILEWQDNNQNRDIVAFVETAKLRLPAALVVHKFLRVLASLFILYQRKTFSVTYESVAEFIVEDLVRGGMAVKHKRVGLYVRNG